MSLVAAIIVAGAALTQQGASLASNPDPRPPAALRSPLRTLNIGPAATRSAAGSSSADADKGSRSRGLPGVSLGRGSRGSARVAARIPLTTPTRPTDDTRSLEISTGGPLGRGLFATSWSSIPPGLDWVSPMVRIDGNGVGDDSWTSRTRFNAAWIAENLSEVPEGRRVLFGWRYRHALEDHAEDRVRRPDGSETDIPSPFLQHATESVRAELTPLLDDLSDLGVAPDRLVLDIESAGAFKSWNIDLDRVAAIMDDPRFDEHRMTNGSTPREMLGVWSADDVKSTIAAGADWNAVMDRLFADAMNASILGPARARWPELGGSNYGSFHIEPAQASADLNGHAKWGRAIVGTASAIDVYGRVRNLGRFWAADPSDPTRLARSNDDLVPTTGWGGLLVDVNQTRAIIRSSTAPFDVWIAQADFQRDDGTGSRYPETPYHRENIFHQALAGTRTFLYWNPSGPAHLESPEAQAVRFADARALEKTLGELNRVTRSADHIRPLVGMRVRWDADVVLSGGELPDGTRVWRLSVSPETDQVEVRIGDRRETIIPSGGGSWIFTGGGEQVRVVEVLRSDGSRGAF